MCTVTRAHLDQRLAAAKRCSREAAIAGAKAAAVATVATAVPTVSTRFSAGTAILQASPRSNNHASHRLLPPCLSLQLASVRMLPWARAHLNPTGQALIISTVAGMAYFIVADKTIVSMARKHSYEDAPEHLKNTSFQ
uniref:Early nodulin-93 n=2 Tax=Aegilops tauschii subsp. strangulata TaxID=200361 RepID=A0A453QNH8_AEGTS